MSPSAEARKAPGTVVLTICSPASISGRPAKGEPSHCGMVPRAKAIGPASVRMPSIKRRVSAANWGAVKTLESDSPSWIKPATNCTPSSSALRTRLSARSYRLLGSLCTLPGAAQFISGLPRKPLKEEETRPQNTTTILCCG